MNTKRMLKVFLVAVLIYAITAEPAPQQKIVGGSLANISGYPFTASLIRTYDWVTFSQACAGSIITTKSILTSANCFYGDIYAANRWRIRVGSSWANSGGTVHTIYQVISHPYFNMYTKDNDIAILRASTNFAYNNNVKAATVAGGNYVLYDNQPVFAVGWGSTYYGGPPSEQLRHVQIWTVNQSTCRNRFALLGYTVTNNMLCSGWLDVGGRGQCQYDAGGPLLHNNVIVGISSWGYQCALPYYPGVNTRVSGYTSWIIANT